MIDQVDVVAGGGGENDQESREVVLGQTGLADGLIGRLRELGLDEESAGEVTLGVEGLPLVRRDMAAVAAVLTTMEELGGRMGHGDNLSAGFGLASSEGILTPQGNRTTAGFDAGQREMVWENLLDRVRKGESLLTASEDQGAIMEFLDSWGHVVRLRRDSTDAYSVSVLVPASRGDLAEEPGERPKPVEVGARELMEAGDNKVDNGGNKQVEQVLAPVAHLTLALAQRARVKVDPSLVLAARKSLEVPTAESS